MPAAPQGKNLERRLGLLAVMTFAVGAFALGSVWYLVFVRKELRTGGILGHLRTDPRAQDEELGGDTIPTVVIPASVARPVSTGLVRLADAMGE